LLKGLGLAVGPAALALAMFNFGSLFGSAGAGWLLDRFGAPLALGVTFTGGAAAFAVMGLLARHIGWLVAGQALFGLLMGCVTSGLIAFSALCYPPAMRSTGIGWAMALGRVGSFCGPLLVAMLVGLAWPAPQIFLAMGMITFIGVFCLFAQGAAGRTSGHGG
jgi:AAHS family 4-hydroxybenzoate transporter-like MFS transporter